MSQKDESMKPLQFIAWVINWVNGLGWQFLNKGKAEEQSSERAEFKAYKGNKIQPEHMTRENLCPVP